MTPTPPLAAQLFRDALADYDAREDELHDDAPWEYACRLSNIDPEDIEIDDDGLTYVLPAATVTYHSDLPTDYRWQVVPSG